MPDKMLQLKVVVMLLSLALLGVGYRLNLPAQRSKKETMAEMGQAYRVLHNKILVGVVDSKFTDADFQEASNQCAAIARLAEEYAGVESKQDLATISRNLARDVQSLKAQTDKKDPLMTTIYFGRVITYCAECHYQARWAPAPVK